MSPHFSIDDLRLIDANANRAREGVRTAEDYIRFHCGHSRWSGRLKRARGAITDCLTTSFSSAQLLAARHVVGDPQRPGPALSAAPAAHESSKAVAQRGLKRAQEALRVLEEYLRAAQPQPSGRLQCLRYELYEAEQWLVLASDAAAVLAGAKVYVLLTTELCRQGLLKTAESVLKGGVRLLQLREKKTPDKLLLEQARDLRALCQSYNAVVICNDRTDLALASGCAGVHVGQDDLPVTAARQVCGERLLVGLSTHSLSQFENAQQAGLDYIAIGAMYSTQSKNGHILAGVGLAEEVFKQEIQLPVYAIGGINLERIEELRRAGVRRVALSSAVISQEDPQTAARRFIDALEN